MIKSAVTRSVATLCALVVSCAVASAQTVPSDYTRDIGSVGATGWATGSNGSFNLYGSGADIWGSSDAFRFVYARLSGDGMVVARVTSLEYVDEWTKAGVMMRESLSSNARHAFMLVSAGNGLAFQRRTSTGGSSKHTSGGSGKAPYWVRLTRSGNTFTAAKSTDGVNWTTVGSETISMGSTIYAGIAVTSHRRGTIASASFASTEVKAGSVSSAAAAPPPPSSSGSGTLRVLHWNVHHGGVGTDGRYDPGRIAAWIAAMKPDIASLNEVDTSSQVNAIVSALQSKTGAKWYVSFSGLGNLVISRLRFNATSRCRYDSSYEAYAPHGSVTVNGRTINVWSSHLHVSSASARLSQVKALQNCAAAWSGARVLAGDYNMQYGSTEYMQAVSGYTDAWLAAKSAGTAVNYSDNCDGCTRRSRIDYVFSNTGASWLRVKSAQIYDTRDSRGVMPSDHKPLLVTYTVN